MKFIRPRRMPEANIQAEIYRQLRNLGIRCCLEYRMFSESNNKWCRADIVTINGDEILAIIETKSRRRGATVNKKGRQYKNYLSFDVPVIYCMNFEQVNEIVEKVKKLHAIHITTSSKITTRNRR